MMIMVTIMTIQGNCGDMVDSVLVGEAYDDQDVDDANDDHDDYDD